jgi:predicted PurR-regulated permease PerM
MTGSEPSGETAFTLPVAGDRVVRTAIVGIFLLMLVAAFYFGKGFLLPVMLAFLLTLILSPVVRVLRRIGLPEGVSAILIVALLTASLAGATWSLSAPVSELIEDAPRIGYELRRKLASLVRPISAVNEARKSIDAATKSDPEPGVQEVVMREPGLFSAATSGASEFLAGAGVMLVLLLFLLASGDLFYEKLVRSMPTMSDKKRWLRIVYDVEREVSRYLLTVSAINFALGAIIAAGLYAVGAPDPLLWGVAAALLNFIPYLGSLVGIAALAVVSVISFPTLGQAMVPPLIYLVFTALEGQFLTPLLVGRRLRFNSVAVFLAIAFWGWLWGAVGIFIAVPVLIVVRTFASHADGLVGLEEFLGVRAARPPEAEREEEAAAEDKAA